MTLLEKRKRGISSGMGSPMKTIMKPRILGNNVATIYTFENVFLSCALVSRRAFIPQLAKKGVGTSGLEYERNSTQHRLFTTPPPPCAKHHVGTLPSTLPRLHSCNVRSFANLCSASSNFVAVRRVCGIPRISPTVSRSKDPRPLLDCDFFPSCIGPTSHSSSFSVSIFFALVLCVLAFHQ